MGASLTVPVDGWMEPRHGRPVPVTGRVANLIEDPAGGTVAVLASGTVRLVVTSRRRPYHRMADFERLGLDPYWADVVVVKIGYLEPELQRLARGWMIALTPGGVDQDLLRLGHQRLIRPLYPFDPEPAAPDLRQRLA